LIRAVKAASHHLYKKSVRLVQAEDLFQDKVVENAEGTGDLEAK